MEREEGRRDSGFVSGAAEIAFAENGGTTRLAHLYQRHPLRVLFPVSEPGEAALAVLITTSGGLVAGDRIAISVQAQPGAVAHVAASAAEKIYRSTGATTQIAQTLSLASGAWLEYLPQETILFEGARLRRHTRIDLAAGAGFLGGGITVFGRRAGAEKFTYGLLHEALEIRYDGALAWGDALHLDGDVAGRMESAACFDGAAACATMVLAEVGNRHPGRLIEMARALQRRSGSAGLRSGVTVVHGVLVARWLGADAASVRRAFVELACIWREAAMGLPARLPRLWHV